MKILTTDRMKSNKLKRRLETVLCRTCWKKRLIFFHGKLNEFNKQKQALAKITVTPKPLPASFKIAYRTAKCKKKKKNSF
jgi:hypothetical protein